MINITWRDRKPVQHNKPDPDKETKCCEDHLTPKKSRVSELSNESLKCDSSAAPVAPVLIWILGARLHWIEIF